MIIPKFGKSSEKQLNIYEMITDNLTVISKKARSLKEVTTKIWWECWDQHIYVVEQFDDNNVRINLWIEDWGGDDISDALTDGSKNVILKTLESS